MATLTTDRAKYEALAAEIEDSVKDYRKVFPEPYTLAPNLALAVRALALLAARPTPDEREIEPYRGIRALFNGDLHLLDPEGNPRQAWLIVRRPGLNGGWTEDHLVAQAQVNAPVRDEGIVLAAMPAVDEEA